MLAVLRWIVVVLAVLGVLLCVLGLTSTTRAPRLGIESPGGLSAQELVRITNVLPGSAAERAGIRPGERIRFASAADASAAAAHLQTTVHLVRANGSVVAVELAPAPRPLVRTMLIVQSLLMSLLVLLLAFRAWHDVQARRLAIGFVWIAWGYGDANVSGWLSIAIYALGDLLTAVGMVALVFFATGWSATPPALARILRRAAVLFGILYLVGNEPGDFGLRVGSGFWIVEQISWPVLALLMIAGLVASTRGAHGVERRRIGWILASMTISFVPFVLYQAFYTLGAVGGFWTWLSFTALVLPFGFGYAMLRHRVIDLGFALNRAAVFAATTALLVGLFGALQWGTDQVLVRATGSQDFAIQMTIAVVVLYVVRALRTRTDALVAHVFFAARRRRIDAIRALATDVDALDDVAAVVPLVRARLAAETGISAAVAFGGAAGPGLAFPLTVRGRSSGALVCVPPPGDADFAPDEHDALALLAGHVALAYRLLERSVHAAEPRAFATAPVAAE
jgi:hypothetical protein